MQLAFDKLKRLVMFDPVPKLPDFEKSFEVHTDASNKVVNGLSSGFRESKLSEVE